jgi:cytidylate kinase
MSVITISRGSFSGGKLLAECLAERLRYRCVDRDVIVNRAATQGVSAEELADALTKPPGFLDRFHHRKYLYLTLIQAALAEEVKEGRVVYHGNAGHLLLAGGGPVLRVRIIAPMDFRVRMCVERLKLSESSAIAYIRKVDSDRKRWTQYLYGVDWQDASLYDIVINLENTSIGEACSIVASMVQAQKCFDFGPKCLEAMANLALASRAKAALALDPATAHLEFSVTASRGALHVKGRVGEVQLIDDIRRVLQAVPGVEEVGLEELSAATPD